MAFNHGLPACLADMREYCDEVLGIRVEPIDLTWLTKAVYNRLNNLEKYTYCLYALKCGSEDNAMVPPRYYKGIQHLSNVVRHLMEDRADYWRRQSRTLYFVENISFRSGPSTIAAKTHLLEISNYHLKLAKTMLLKTDKVLRRHGI